MYESLNREENFALVHWARFGSDGYPVSKLGKKWLVTYPAGNTLLFNTKSAAWLAWDNYITSLRDRAAGRA